jgi:hypothetical protein
MPQNQSGKGLIQLADSKKGNLYQVLVGNTAKIALFIIIVCAALVRIGYLIQLQDDPLPWYTAKDSAFDASRYVGLAKEFKDINWLGLEVTRYSAAYSYIIAVLFVIFGTSVNVIFVFQIILALFACYVIYKCCVLLFSSKGVGISAAFITAFCGTLVFYECSVSRDLPIAYSNLFAFYFLLMAIKQESRKALNIAIAGLFLGVSMLLRPNVLIIFIIPYLFLGVKEARKERLLRILLLLFMITLVLAPLQVRNLIVGGQVQIESQGSMNFWLGNTYKSPGVGFFGQSALSAALTKESKDSMVKTVAIFAREVRNHPREYGQLYLRKIKMFFNGYESPSNLSFDLTRQLHWILRFLIFDVTVIFPLALLGIILTFRKYAHLGLLYIFLFVLSFSVILFSVMGYYRVVSLPFFIIFAAYTLHQLFCLLKQRRIAAFCCVTMILIVLSIYTLPDNKIIRDYYGTRIRSIDYGNLGAAYLDDFVTNYKILGQRRSRELLQKSVDVYRKAAQLAPNLYLKDLGIAYYFSGHDEDAKECFTQFLDLKPDSGNANVAKYYLDLLNK